MTTSPWLSNVRKKGMITPVSHLRTTVSWYLNFRLRLYHQASKFFGSGSSI